MKSLVALMTLLTFELTLSERTGLHTEVQHVYVQGEIMLGGLFPVHSKYNSGSSGSSGQCGKIQEQIGIQRLEAMLYAIKTVNNNTNLLQNITLGVEAYDTCSSDTKALEETMNFIHQTGSDNICVTNSTTTSKKAVGVIGGLFSYVSIQVAHLLRLFQVPQISYDSSSSELSDKSRYEYFSRTVPPDLFQAKAIIDVLGHFGWTYVSVVYSDDTYGRTGYEALEQEAEKNGICFAAVERIEGKSHNFSATLQRLEAEPTAKTVVVFCNQIVMVQELLAAAKKMKMIGRFQWVGSDTWGTVSWLTGLHDVAAGAIVIAPNTVQNKGFLEYFKSLRPENNHINPWFNEFWMDHFQCNLDNQSKNFKRDCNRSDKIENDNFVDMRAVNVINAVYAFAHALHNMNARLCGSKGMCPAMSNIDGQQLLLEVRNVSFVGSNGDRVKFDVNGDVNGNYRVTRFQKIREGYKNEKIGEWNHGLHIFWNPRPGEIRNSMCSVECGEDEVRKPVKGKEQCCWICTPCRGNSFIQNTTCITCPLGEWPSPDKQTCITIKPVYFSFAHDLGIVAAVFSLIGIICVSIVIGVFVKYGATPLVKASARELCYLLLAGLLWCYLITFFAIVKPSDFLCALYFCGTSIAFTICYGSILVKTNRISRIFNRKHITRRPTMIQPSTQLFFVFCLVLVQALFQGMFLLMRTPKALVTYASESELYLECSYNDIDLLVSQGFNLVLLILCTLYAFKTRNIPGSFNESKHIAFTMYTTSVMWLGFITVFYALKDQNLAKTPIVCLNVIICAFIVLFCLFGPKVYVILLQPHNNVRRPTIVNMSISSNNSEPRHGYMYKGVPTSEENGRNTFSRDHGCSIEFHSSEDHTGFSSVEFQLRKEIGRLTEDLEETKQALRDSTRKNLVNSKYKDDSEQHECQQCGLPRKHGSCGEHSRNICEECGTTNGYRRIRKISGMSERGRHSDPFIYFSGQDDSAHALLYRSPSISSNSSLDSVDISCYSRKFPGVFCKCKKKNKGFNFKEKRERQASPYARKQTNKKPANQAESRGQKGSEVQGYFNKLSDLEEQLPLSGILFPGETEDRLAQSLRVDRPKTELHDSAKSKSLNNLFSDGLAVSNDLTFSMS